MAEVHTKDTDIIYVLDGTKMIPWVRRFASAAGTTKLIWGLHNYIDANRFRETGTKALLKAVKGDVWFTETGGLVRRNNGSTIEFPGSTRHAAEATNQVFKLAALSSRGRALRMLDGQLEHCAAFACRIDIEHFGEHSHRRA